MTPGPLAPARELLGEMLLEANQPAKALEEFETNAEEGAEPLQVGLRGGPVGRTGGRQAESADLLRSARENLRTRRPPGPPRIGGCPDVRRQRDSLLPGRDGSGLAHSNLAIGGSSHAMVTRDLERDMSRYPNCSVNLCTRTARRAASPNPRAQYVSLRGRLCGIWRIVRKQNSVKFFVFNNQQWCESHPVVFHFLADGFQACRDISSAS